MVVMIFFSQPLKCPACGGEVPAPTPQFGLWRCANCPALLVISIAYSREESLLALVLSTALAVSMGFHGAQLLVAIIGFALFPMWPASAAILNFFDRKRLQPYNGQKLLNWLRLAEPGDDARWEYWRRQSYLGPQKTGLWFGRTLRCPYCQSVVVGQIIAAKGFECRSCGRVIAATEFGYLAGLALLLAMAFGVADALGLQGLWLLFGTLALSLPMGVVFNLLDAALMKCEPALDDRPPNDASPAAAEAPSPTRQSAPGN